MPKLTMAGLLCLALACVWNAACPAAEPITIGLSASLTVRRAMTEARIQKEPITIGLSASLTGPLAVNGKPGLVAMQIWEEDTNAHGGLLGRQVKLVYYDDQSNPANIPTIYSKLLDVDKVDLLVGTGTNLLAAALPIAMQHQKLLMGILGTGVNDDYKYPRYFSMNPVGPDAKPALTIGFFRVAMEQKPRPKTVGIVSSAAEYGRNCLEGARVNAAAAKLKIVYDRTYPPGGAADMTPIVRSVQASQPDLVVVCSYPLESVAILRAVSEIGYSPKMIGGGMVGPQATTLKEQLGPLLNGVVTFDLWLPTNGMQFPGVMAMLAKYQARAAREGVDLLGYYMPPWAYAAVQTLGLAITATHSLDNDKLAKYMRKASFDTVVGPVSFSPIGEWAKERMLQVQYRNIHGNSLDEIKSMDKLAIVTPRQFKTGDLIYPYAAAKQ